MQPLHNFLYPSQTHSNLFFALYLVSTSVYLYKWEKVEVEWSKIEPEECQKLIESMPRRLDAVIKAKGGHTKY